MIFISSHKLIEWSVLATRHLINLLQQLKHIEKGIENSIFDDAGILS